MPSLLGSKPNQVSTNGDLGTLAFQDSNAVNITGGTVDVSAGTAALPTLGTTGDPNTGVFFPAADTIAFSEGGVEAMRIDSSGNVGIGTTSPASRLHVVGTGNTLATIGGSTGQAGISLISGGAFSPYMNWYSSGTTLEASIYAVAGSGAFVIGTGASGTERMRIDTAGNVLVGTTSAVSGGAKLQTVDGITFPATQVASANANTLDDYEEGTWTPSDGSTAGLTFTVLAARYVKVGRIVHCQFQLTYPTTVNTFAARIDGLPFTPASNINSNGYLGSTAAVGIAIQTAGSTNTNILNAIGAAATLNSTLSGALVYGTFTYFV